METPGNKKARADFSGELEGSMNGASGTDAPLDGRVNITEYR